MVLPADRVTGSEPSSLRAPLLEPVARGGGITAYKLILSGRSMVVFTPLGTSPRGVAVQHQAWCQLCTPWRLDGGHRCGWRTSSKPGWMRWSRLVTRGREAAPQRSSKCSNSRSQRPLGVGCPAIPDPPYHITTRLPSITIHHHPITIQVLTQVTTPNSIHDVVSARPNEAAARDDSSQCWRWDVWAVFSPLSASQVAF